MYMLQHLQLETSVDEFVSDPGIEAGEVIEMFSYRPIMTSVDELMGDFVMVETSEVIEIFGHIPTITRIDEFMSYIGIEAGEVIPALWEAKAGGSPEVLISCALAIHLPQLPKLLGLQA